MRLNISRVILSALIVCACTARAGEWHKIPAELASPVTTPARGWLIGGGLLTGLALATDYDVEDPLQKSWSTRKPLGHLAEVGDLGGQAITNLLYVGGMLTSHWISGEKIHLRRATIMAKVSGYAISVNYALKLMVNEQRPNGTDHKSFPSGHSAAAFAFSTVVWTEHGWKYGVPATMLSILTAASRINDNMHSLHDVIAGATVGISYGLGLHYSNKSDETKSGRIHWQFIPVISKNVQLGLISASF